MLERVDGADSVTLGGSVLVGDALKVGDGAAQKLLRVRARTQDAGSVHSVSRTDEGIGGQEVTWTHGHGR